MWAGGKRRNGKKKIKNRAGDSLGGQSCKDKGVRTCRGGGGNEVSRVKGGLLGGAAPLPYRPDVLVSEGELGRGKHGGFCQASSLLPSRLAASTGGGVNQMEDEGGSGGRKERSNEKNYRSNMGELPSR